jgi:hypothetical protein
MGSIPVGSAEEANFDEGDVVAANFDSGNWYKAEVAGKDGARYVVNTPSGRQAYLEAGKLRRLTRDLKLAAGQRVAALYGEEKFYGAVVQSVGDGGATLAWVDGTAPSFVPFHAIIADAGDYEYKKIESDAPADLVKCVLAGKEYAYNRRNGRVLINGGLAGHYDAATGRLTALSSYNSSGSIDQGDRSTYGGPPEAERDGSTTRATSSWEGRRSPR